jgi:branched-chain amino acid transport system substrate-binding protein
MNCTAKSFKLFACFILFILVLAFPLAASAKDTIRIGRVIPLSGHNAIVLKSASGPVYDLWVEEVNARGGIYVKKYGKKLPIELIQYDGKSDHGTMVKLLEKLILRDKVDFIFAPVATSQLFAAAPIANKYKYLLFGAEGGALKLKDIIKGLPYFFAVLNFADTQMPALADVYKRNGIKSVAIIYIEDLHGIEYSDTLAKALKAQGIEVKMKKSIPLGIKDLSSLLKQAKSLDVDAFVGFTYPGETILATKQSMELNINFKAFHLNVGPSFGFYPGIFGPATQGVTGSGAWNHKTSPGAKAFVDKMVAKFGKKAPIDFWGQLFYYASLEFFEKAIVKVGSLDQKKIRDVFATEKFDTALGSTWFENGFLAHDAHPGEIGQWQNGVYEVISRKAKATSNMIMPKPVWPKPAPKK